MTKLIITNGDSAASRLKELGLADKVLPWRDVLHEGPVPHCTTLAEQSRQRADFIASFADMPIDDIRADFAERDEVFKNAASYDRVELWFEHDLYDQLQLMQILSVCFQEMPTLEIYLVQADDFLAEITDDALSNLSSNAKLLGKNKKEYAHRAWLAFVNSTPDLINDMLQENTVELPFIEKALKRISKEYPHAENGVSLSATYALKPLLKDKFLIKDLFKSMQKAEEAKFMGDLSFAHMIDGFIKDVEPIIEGAKPLNQLEYMDFFNQEVQLTPFGRNVLEMKANYVEVNGIDRWIGGVHLMQSA